MTIEMRRFRVRGVRKFVMDGEHLELRAITKEQSGSYECIASNDISTPDTGTVQTLLPSPVLGVQVRLSDRRVFSNAKPPLFQDQISSGTRKTAGELFNGLNGVKIENQGKISMLVFFNVSEEDYGNYTCVAMNKMGVTNASIILYGPGAMHDVNGAALSPYCAQSLASDGHLIVLP
ncbi:Opioid-binding protein/cell adhesion molecule [Merluccius polli]|uniref:Opioid-binding protein/cell adhesion molecule n=1 Tax=Merluccius polli TaxID=89951 RepID=A0AA47PDC7_MERPO|nr:Opioid-binding protein/cell adhesion molecule [Merluccius polli]